MPLKHLRVCPSPCHAVRFAACSAGCHLPIDTDAASWRDNLQDGAGTVPAGHATPIATRP